MYAGLEVLVVVTVKSTIFWDVAPYHLLEVYPCFRGIYCLHLQGQRVRQAACFLLITCLAYSLALKMEAVHPFRMLVNFHQTTLRHIPEDRTLVSNLLQFYMLYSKNSLLAQF
jgi:hypothetical protein